MTVLGGGHLTFRRWLKQLALPILILVGILLLAAAMAAWLGLG